MVSNSIVIQRDLEAVWAKIEGEFRRAFNFPKGDLQGHSFSVKTRSYLGKPILATQRVVEFIPGVAIALESQNQNDVITSRYQLEAASAGSTRVTLSVEGKNTGSKLRSWNYILMSWPLFRGGAKKRLSMQLESLKSLIEGEGGK